MTLPNRTLAVIADELHTALKRETSDIIDIGGLLIEAKAQVAHGEWLPWLKNEVSISERSAQKYIKAAEFAAKNELSADLNFSPSALYLLSEDSYWGDGYGRREATQAVINAARDGRVGYDRAKEIIDKKLARNGGLAAQARVATPTRTAETRPRGAAPADRDARRVAGIHRFEECIDEIKKIISAPIFDDSDRVVFRRSYSPHLDGFIDERGKLRFESQVTAVERPPVTGSPQGNGVSPEEPANDQTSNSKHDLAA